MPTNEFDATVPVKAAARRRLRAAVGAMTPEERAAASARIRGHLADSGRLPGGARVLVFAALPDEPDLLPLVFGGGAGDRGSGDPGGAPSPPPRTWVFPRVIDRVTLELRAVAEEAFLVPGVHGIREPDPGRCPLVAPGEIEVALVPGVGFRRSDGMRIGRGGGYYDRLLAGAFRATTIGIGFDCQFVDDLPAEPHDFRMDFLAGPSGWITPTAAPSSRRRGSRR